MATVIATLKEDNGGFAGTFETLAIRTRISIQPASKSKQSQPDYRVYANQRYEIGGGWIRDGNRPGETYVRVSLAAPELGRTVLYANLVQLTTPYEDGTTHVLLWNAIDD